MRKKTVFADITDKHTRAQEYTPRVVLSHTKRIHIPISKTLRYALISFFIFSFVLGSVNAPVDRGAVLAATSKEAERAQLEAELRDLEEQIAQYENTVADYRQQGVTLESEIKRLNANIAKLNLQIRAINLNLDSLDNQIDQTKTEISKTENNISSQKETLSSLLQNVYQNENKTVVEMIVENPKLSDFFLNLNNLLVLQDSVRITLEQVVALKSDLIDQKENLALEYEDVSQLKQYQENQKLTVAQTESEKAQLLEVTKGEEAKYQQILEEKKKSAADIRSRIFELIGGGELSFGEAYRLAEIAVSTTNVSAAMVLAVLDRESALGKNVGQCEYDVNPYYPASASNKTTMHPTRDIPVFLDILAELDRANIPVPNPPMVSCPIPRDGAYGGAMGPAQFIPSTWDMYADRIADVTGHKVASPWNNLDAFTGTALYLNDAYNSSSCVQYARDYPEYDSDLLQSRCAAAKYYAGGRWWNYRWTYGEATLERARQFQKDIDILNG